MTVAVLLRLVAETLAEGRVSGHAEIVDTGETLVFKDQDEMLAFLRRASLRLPAEGTAQATSDKPDMRSTMRGPR